jgi:hypothetical protein
MTLPQKTAAEQFLELLLEYEKKGASISHAVALTKHFLIDMEKKQIIEIVGEKFYKQKFKKIN